MLEYIVIILAVFSFIQESEENFYIRLVNYRKSSIDLIAQLAEAVEYPDCTSAGG